MKKATKTTEPVAEPEKCLGASAAELEADSAELQAMKSRFNRILANFEKETDN